MKLYKIKSGTKCVLFKQDGFPVNYVTREDLVVEPGVELLDDPIRRRNGSTFTTNTIGSDYVLAGYALISLKGKNSNRIWTIAVPFTKENFELLG